MEVLANHLRISKKQCAELVKKLKSVKKPFHSFDNFVDKQRERWANEAANAIDKYELASN